MSDPGTILIFLMLVIGALLTVSFVNQQQMRSRVINQKVAQLKRRVGELDEMASSLESLVESLAIPKTILDEMLEVLNTIDKLEPNNPFCESTRISTEQRIEDLMDATQSHATYRAQPSDAAIARTKYLLNEAAMIIRKRQVAGKLEIVEMEAFINELAWASLMVVVITHVVEGHKAVNRGDVLKAYAFYRKAQQVLIKGSINEERRHRMIKELSEIMGNKRKTLSKDLMPETQHNPSADSADLIRPEDAEAAAKLIQEHSQPNP
ncbi:hypothetical protein [Saccharophagus degradans]|nr:hypothetical protein [Saccharophagus degradans]